MRAGRFTPERRERLLVLLELGRSLEEACASAQITRATVAKWAARGRLPDADAEVADFARRLDAIRVGADGARLTEDDALRLLERAARRGSVAAIKALLQRLGEEGEPAREPMCEEVDPFSLLPGDELGEPLQRARADGTY